MTDEKMVAALRHCVRAAQECTSCDGCPAGDDWILCEQANLYSAVEIIDRLREENRQLRARWLDEGKSEV